MTLKKAAWSRLFVLAILTAVAIALATASAGGPRESLPAPPSAPGGAASVIQDEIIIDHTCTDLASIPSEWIEQAKDRLRVSYGHTSHGSQIITGMEVLSSNSSTAGLYDFTTDGSIVSGMLSIADATPEGDLGNPDRVTWA